MSRLRQVMRTVTRQQMLPKMVVAGEMMAMNLVELEQKLQGILEENPALDFSDDGLCFFCGGRLGRHHEQCPNCGRNLRAGSQNEMPIEDVPSIHQMRNWKNLLQEEIESFVELVPEDINLFRLLIINLDREGFLRVDLDQLALIAQETEGRIRDLIDRIRAAGFPGFACRDAVEFLVVQLRDLGTLDSSHSFDAIRKEIRRSPQWFEKLVETVRDRLSYSPAQLFEASLGQERDIVSSEEEYIRWDAEIWENEEGRFDVALLSSSLLDVNINREFVRIVNQETANFSEKDRLYCQEKLREAKEVISCLSYRHRLLLSVLQYIVSQEQDYFRHGFRYYVPLKQREIAEALGVSNSGICQILKNKAVRFPEGTVRDIKFFFNTSYPVKEMIRILLARENPRHPFSDRKLQMELKENGFALSRRSITLYREDMGVLPSFLRRRMWASTH
ncbi:MAG TPA: hypothetical protein VLH40_02240 [Atribacteraceae bacterium]|nr:hypothetical protein [Atribacteraceae bacterium]